MNNSVLSFLCIICTCFRLILTPAAAEAASPPPAKLVPGVNMVLGQSFYVLNGTEYRKPRVTFPGVAAAKFYWSTSIPDANTGLIAENQFEILQLIGSGGVYKPMMTDSSKNGVLAPPQRLDWSIWSSSETTRASKFRCAYRRNATSVLSEWSEPVTVPLVAASPTPTTAKPTTTPAPTTAQPATTVAPTTVKPTTTALHMSGLQTWLPAILRPKGVYEDNEVSSPGMQFQRAVVWNQGVNDPAKRNTWISGQDENRLWWSNDKGATVSPVPMFGMFGARIGGLYANSDDNIMLVICSGMNNMGRGGLYISRDWGITAHRCVTIRNDGPGPSAPNNRIHGFVRPASGASMRMNQNQIARRPQNAQQTLTNAQRPIYAIEQVTGNVGSTDSGDWIQAIYIWISSDNGATWSVVRELPVASYAIEDDGIYYIDVAPNGDVIFSGKKGVWISTDGFATNPTKLYSGEVSSQAVQKGTTSSAVPAAAYISLRTAPFGILYSSNVRNVLFAKPTGQNLPANAEVSHMGVSPVNFNRVMAVVVGNGGWLSTNGAKSFSPITSISNAGDADKFRYKLDGGRFHSGFYPHPRSEMDVMAMSSQTMTRSVNGGVSFNASLVNFFDGSHTKGDGFDLTDWRKMNFVQQDRTLQVTYDGLNYVDRGDVVKSTKVGASTLGDLITAAGGGDKGYTSGSAAGFCPNGRIIVAINRNTASQNNVPVIVEPLGDDSYGKITVRGDVNTSRCQNSYRSPKNNDGIFMGRWYITNLGAADPKNVRFTDRIREIAGYALVNNSTLITYWVEKSASGNQIWRSTAVDGSGQTVWFTLPKVDGVQVNFKGAGMTADPFTTERVLLPCGGEKGRPNNGKIWEIKKVGSSLVLNELVDLRPKIQAILTAQLGTSNFVLPETEVTQILADHRMRGLFYAIVDLHGIPSWWMTTDGGQTWNDITNNLPRTSFTGNVHPLTGDVFAYSSHGTWVLPPPMGYPTFTNKGAAYAQLKAYYQRPGIPDPRLYIPPVVVVAKLDDDRNDSSSSTAKNQSSIAGWTIGVIVVAAVAAAATVVGAAFFFVLKGNRKNVYATDSKDTNYTLM